MGMFSEECIFSSLDEYDPDPIIRSFDEIINTTNKAVLYKYGHTQFWVPKSIHSVAKEPKNGCLGELIIEGWATITVFEYNDFIPSKASNKIVMHSLFSEDL